LTPIAMRHKQVNGAIAVEISGDDDGCGLGSR
jgi:hypothetical protein